MTDPSLPLLQPQQPEISEGARSIAEVVQQLDGGASGFRTGRTIGANGIEPSATALSLSSYYQQQDGVFVDRMREAIQHDPAMYATARKVGQQVGVEPLSAERDIKFYKQVARERQIEDMNLAVNAPGLNARLLEDLDFARVAHNEIERFSWLERGIRQWNKGQLETERSLAAFEASKGGPDAEQWLNWFRSLDYQVGKIPEPIGWAAATAEVLGQAKKIVVESLEYGFGAAAGASPAALAGPAGAVPVLAIGGVGALARGIQLSYETLAGEIYADLLVQAPQLEADAKALGVPWDREKFFKDAWLASRLGGAANAAVEALGGKIAAGAAGLTFKPLLRRWTGEMAGALVKETTGKAVGRAALGYMMTMGGEVLTESVEQVVNIAATDWATRGSRPGTTSAEAWEQIREVAGKTAKAMALLAIPGPGLRLAFDRQRIKQAEREQSFWAAIEQGVSPEILANAPDAAASFVASQVQGQPSETTYVNAEQLRKTFAQRDEEVGRPGATLAELEAKIPGLTERLAAATTEGDSVAIPTSDFATNILLDKNLGPAIKPHVKLRADGFTMAEAEQVAVEGEKMQEAIAEDAEKRAEGEDAFRQSSERVASGISAQLQGYGFSPNQADASAAAYSAIVRQRARREGVTPEEWHRTKGMGLDKQPAPQSPDADTFEQPSLKTDTPEFKAWFGESKVVDDAGKPMVVYHGTDADFTSFNADKSPLMFFSESKDTAGAYASNRSQGRGGRVVDAWVSANNPATAADVAEVDISKEVEALADINSKDAAYLAERAAFIKKRIAGTQGWMFTKEAERGVWRDVLVPALKRAGFDSLRLEDAADTGGSLAVFDPTQIKSVNNRGTFDPNDPNILRQGAKARFDPSRMRTILHEKADVSSFIHESAHFYLTVLSQAADAQSQKDMQLLLDWFGVKDAETWNAMSVDQQRRYHEQFAYSFESYVAEGKAPSIVLQGVFDRFAAWLRDIYKNVVVALSARYKAETGVDLPAMSPEVRGVMDRMLASEDEIAMAEAVNNEVPAYGERKDFKGTDEEWAAWVASREEQRLAAEAELTTESLKAAGWVAKETAKEGKRLNRELKRTKKELTAKEKEAIGNQPVYRAIRAFKSGDAPKISTEAARKALGATTSDQPQARAKSLLTRVKELGGIRKDTFPGESRAEFNIPFLFRKDGMAWEDMAQQLGSEGYGPATARAEFAGAGEGSGSQEWFIDAIGEEQGGAPVYSRFDYAKVAGETPSGQEIEQDAQRREVANRRMRRLGSLRITSPDGTEDLDAFAEVLGFTDASTMLREIADATSEELAIEQSVGESLAANYPELTDPEARQAAIDRAIHNEARRRFLAVQLRHLEKSKLPTRLAQAAAKEQARRRLEGMTLADVQPHRFVLQEAKASREVLKAIKAGDATAAAQWTRRQMLNSEMARQASDIRDEVEVAKRKMAKFAQPDDKITKSRNIDYVNAGRAILSTYPGLVDSARITNPADHLLPLKAYDLPTYERLLPYVANNVASTDADYRNLSVAQFRDLADQMELLWDQARREELIELDGKLVRRAEVIEELSATLPAVQERGIVTDAERNASKWTDYRNSLQRVQFLMLKLDGGKPGVWTRTFWRPMDSAFQAYVARKNEMYGKLRAEFNKLEMSEAKIPAPELGDGVVLNGTKDLLGVLLHLGNPNNRRLLLLGYGWATESNGVLEDGRFRQFIDRLHRDKVLRKEHWDFAQGVWDLNESMKAEAQKINRHVYGTYFKEIPAQPVETPWGTLRGGYMPAKREGLRSDRVAQQTADALSDMEATMGELMGAIGTGRGFTIERTGSVGKLSLDASMAMSHIGEVLRFVHMQPVIKDLVSLLRNRKFYEQFQQAVPGVVDGVLFPWLERTSKDRVVLSSGGELQDTIFSAVRASAGFGFMFGNVRVALQQVTGLSNALQYVKGSSLSRAFWQVVQNGSELQAMMVAKSQKMANIVADENAMQHASDIRDTLNPTRLGSLKQWQNKYGYVLQRTMQNQVNKVVWLGAYRQKLDEVGSTMEADAADREAVRWADEVVTLSQGGAQSIDVARFEVGTPAWRLFTQFSTYFNTVLNQITTAKPGAERAVAVLRAMVIPSLVAASIGAALSGGAEFDDEDKVKNGVADEVAWWLFSTQIKGAAGMVPVFGNLVASVATSERRPGDRITPAPFWSALQSADRLVGHIGALAEGKPPGIRAYRDLAQVLALFGLPATPAVIGQLAQWFDPR